MKRGAVHSFREKRSRRKPIQRLTNTSELFPIRLTNSIAKIEFAHEENVWSGHDQPAVIYNRTGLICELKLACVRRKKDLRLR